LQDIRHPDSAKEGYADAQTAQISVTAEKANLEAATVKAQLKVATATAEAEAMIPSRTGEGGLKTGRKSRCGIADREAPVNAVSL
jgi:hypothetical protein